MNGFLLREIQRDDLPQMLEWRNSERIRRNMFTDHLIAWEEHLAWFERLAGHPRQVSLIFAWGEKPLGVVQFQQIEAAHRRCQWGFYMGAEDRPSGSGMEMGRLSLQHGFSVLGLHKLCGEVFSFNQASRNFFLRLGFQEEGCLREHVQKNQRFEDLILFGLLKEEWLKRENNRETGM